MMRGGRGDQSLIHTEQDIISHRNQREHLRSTVQYSAGGCSHCSQVTVANKNALVFTKVNLVHSGVLLYS